LRAFARGGAREFGDDGAGAPGLFHDIGETVAIGVIVGRTCFYRSEVMDFPPIIEAIAVAINTGSMGGTGAEHERPEGPEGQPQSSYNAL
jgi:hypothetical protein